MDSEIDWSFFIWAYRSSVLQAISQVVLTLDGRHPRQFVSLGEFRDAVAGYRGSSRPSCILVGNDLRVTIERLSASLGVGGQIIACDLGQAPSHLMANLSHVPSSSVRAVRCYELVDVVVEALIGSRGDAVDIPSYVAKEMWNMSYAEAEKAALRILAIERCQAVSSEWPSAETVSVEVERTPPILCADTRKLRSQLWHLCKNVVRRHSESTGGDDLVLQALADLQLWEKVELGSSHPELATIGGLLREGKRDEAATLAGNIYLGLMTHGASVSLETAESPPVSQRIVAETQPSVGGDYKRFDILVVDDSDIDLVRAMSVFRRLSQSCSSYTIEVIGVDPTDAFNDAMRKLRKHPSIQAVIVDWDLAAGRKGRGGGAGQTGVDLVQRVRDEMPWLYLCLLTGRGVMNVLQESRDFDVRPYDKHDVTSLEEIFADILQHVRSREEMPFFSSLKEYSQRPMTVFHAMTVSRGRSLRKSTWLGEFYDFYGDRVFMAETSSTEVPLDSLFEPKGSIKRAQDMAASVFGAEQTYFVTNGTSTANKIVHQAVLEPGEVVLIDRNCHKSHHYGMVLVGARPVYLQAEPLFFEDEFTGICKGVTTTEILSKLNENPGARMLCLTNCTFDGYVHDVANIIAKVHARLNEMAAKLAACGGDSSSVTKPEDFIFLFDEAWFGYARFVGDLRPFTAMAACVTIPNARVYVTQSTHKTLTAFRQASMIHVRDPKFRSVEHRLNEAMYTHASTSPSYNLIASLDAGRMQADLEGARLCEEAWGLAKNLRSFLATEDRIHEFFNLVTPDEMGCRASGASGDFALDLTKITLFLRKASGLTGSALRRRMLNDFNVQFNKVTDNTVLLMVNAGSTESSIGHLVTSLRRMARGFVAEGPKEREGILPSDIFKRPVKFWCDKNTLREYFFGQLPGCEEETVGLDEAKAMITKDQQILVSANFVIPYPPGFPVMVPGEIIDTPAIDYLKSLRGGEIHGMPGKGKLRIWVARNQA